MSERIAKISRALCGLSFLLMLGIVGGMELGDMSLIRGCIGSALSLGSCVLFAYVGGMFG